MAQARYSSSARPIELRAAVEKKNLSGLTYNPYTKTYYGIINRGDHLYEFDEKFNLVANREIIGFDDPEDITFVRMTSAGPEVAISDESGAIYIGVLKTGIIRPSDMKEIALIDERGSRLSYWNNKGLEGITYLPQQNTFVVVQEKPVRIWSFQLDPNSTTAQLKPTFPAALENQIRSFVTDLSAVSYDAKTNELALLSDESSAIVYVNSSHVVTKIITLESRLQPEGLSFTPDFSAALVVSEPYYLMRVDSTNTRKVSK